MRFWQKLWCLHTDQMKAIMKGKTEQMVGVEIPLNGSNGYDENLFANQTVVKDGLTSTLIYVRELGFCYVTVTLI